MNKTSIEPKRRPTKTDEWIIERGLMAMADQNGNSRKACAFLKEQEIVVDHTTLWSWAFKKFPDRYEAIRAEVLPRIRTKTADEHIDLARLNMEVERMTLEEYKEKLPELPARDLSGSSRNFAVGAAVHTEKSEMLNDRPTQRVAIDLPGVLKDIKSMGVDPAVVLDGEVVEEEDLTEPTGTHL